MMIEKHISALLYRYQCVTVPGFGAFLAETTSAQLDNDTHTFYPPKKLISFNANLKNNDGLLGNHIALQEKISYDAAVAEINSAVSHWLNELHNNQTLVLKNIGSITNNAEGNLVFTPDTPVNYLTDSFGLSSFISPAIKREEYKIIAEAIEEKAPVVFTPERKKNYSYLKYAAIFVVALGVGSVGFKFYRENEIATETLLVQQQAQEEVQQKIQEATFFIENPFAVTLPVKEEVTSMPYHVVAGAFRSEENAATAVEQLITKGYKAAKSIEKNKFGLYPVIYSSYTTNHEAQEALNKIRLQDNDEAWLLIKE
ncbi:SPOR domain-containing protein [Flavobacterium arcticum]|uniref:SPOR domain-containing protein n=1 Tax=Flavobacterium arcticum TaxID=1784713 RepID=A0A345HAW9_9FLAO|nr:SPOR domain-containing protein [Flavobacterium arcticum]AXG73729.1 SPOR domain-containing protein [Flavobacterium arcticum]KAF2511680.1 SPOR domain-containing protein [Flavobacterium arcticum]